MQKIEIKNRRDLEIFCPFCGVKVIASDGIKQCEHVIFHANDYGFEYVSVGIGFDVKVELEDMSVDEYTDNLEIENAFKFAIYDPAPGSFGGYIGFRNN